MKKSALYLRVFHGLVLAYFTFCLFYLYYVGLSGNVVSDVLFAFVIITVALESAMVFLANNGDCPLIHIQRKLGDETPFFELVFPQRVAKYAIQVYAGLGLIAMVIILLRFVVGA